MSQWFEKTIRRSPDPLPPDASRDSLLAAVLAAPDDDRPRRVYADWLLDQGDPRGEFILVQCALAQLEEEDLRTPELRMREAALLKTHKKEWVGRFRGARIEYGVKGSSQWVKGNPTHWMFVRGFVDLAKMSMDDFCANAEALLACEPVRMVKLTRGSLPEFLDDCPSLERLRGLDLSRVKLRRPALEALFSCQRLTEMTNLSVSECGIGMRGFQAASDALDPAAFPAMERLMLWGNGIGDKGVSSLLGAHFATQLKNLSLGKNKVREAGGRALANSERLAEIEKLFMLPHEIPPDIQAELRARYGERISLSYE